MDPSPNTGHPWIVSGRRGLLAGLTAEMDGIWVCVSLLLSCPSILTFLLLLFNCAWMQAD
jgi:hypothetical protein